MAKELSLYNWNQQIHNYKKKIRDDTKIHPKNKKAITDFVEYKASEVYNSKPISKGRQVKLLYRLRLIATETPKPPDLKAS